MKSTLKIDYSSRHSGGHPVIKIVQPKEILQKEDFADDIDVRDILIRDFLHTPSMCDRNAYFQLGTHFPVPYENPTHFVSNIEVLPEDTLFYTFKHAIINRLIPYNKIIDINTNEPDQRIVKSGDTDYYAIHKKIEDFFKWVDETGYCAYETRQP